MACQWIMKRSESEIDNVYRKILRIETNQINNVERMIQYFGNLFGYGWSFF